MIKLKNWALRHSLSIEAMAELQHIFTHPSGIPSTMSGASEAAISNTVRLEASYKGGRLWRNNVGACEDKRGRLIRYGLANDSKVLNKVLKSSDLIGINPVLITYDMVGSTIGQFVAREVKSGDWSFSFTDREEAQMNFLELVISLGGDACFCNDVGTL
jgi:hypothetical protein